MGNVAFHGCQDCFCDNLMEHEEGRQSCWRCGWSSDQKIEEPSRPFGFPTDEDYHDWLENRTYERMVTYYRFATFVIGITAFVAGLFVGIVGSR